MDGRVAVGCRVRGSGSADVNGWGWRARESTGLVLVLLMLVILFSVATEHFLFSVATEHFLSSVTFTTLANQLPALGVIVVGMTLVLIAGGIDLSVGSVMALGAAVLGVTLTRWHWPVPFALAACVGVGALAGLVNGLVTVRWSIPSFIVTLGMLEVARGVAYVVTDSRS